MHDPIREMYFWFFFDLSTCNNFLWKYSASGYGTLKNSFAVVKNKNKSVYEAGNFMNARLLILHWSTLLNVYGMHVLAFYMILTVGVVDLYGNIFLRMIVPCC
ncbi:hypothetical protein Dimus_004198 [Dionaea muscipula]